MTQTTDSVITLERFQTGKTFQEYLDSGIRNRELFEENYEGTKPTAEQEAALKELAGQEHGPHHVVVIGEDWCPDVYRGAPVAARIAETMGIEYRFFERDENKDMIAGYLKDGEFESIPVLIFYDKDHQELGHFIERPAIANEELHLAREAMGDTSPAAMEKELGASPSEDEVKAFRAKARERYLEWQKGPTWANWRSATIDEVIALLRA